MHSVEQLIFSNGERYPMLVDGEGVPHFWITLFVTAEVRNNGCKQNTINSYLYDIGHFLLWEEIQGRDILSEFEKCKFLSQSDAIALRDFCLLETGETRKWYKRNKSTTIRKLNNTYPSVPRTLDRVCGNHAKTRYSRIASYLKFVASTLLRTRPNFTVLYQDIKGMYEILEKNMPAGGRRRSIFNPDDKAPPPEIFEEFIESIQFDSPKNPYKNLFSRKRNEAFLNLMYETGARGAELLTLTVKSITWHDNPPMVKIKTLPIDTDDPRKRKPSIKTEDREIAISMRLNDQLFDYVRYERSMTMGKNSHDYLFTSHQGKTKGQPLTMDGLRDFVTFGVNKVAQQADSYKKEDLLREIKKHGFRHNFNYILSEKFDLLNKESIRSTGKPKYSKKDMDEIRMYLNGWVDEATVQTYNVRFTADSGAIRPPIPLQTGPPVPD